MEAKHSIELAMKLPTAGQFIGRTEVGALILRDEDHYLVVYGDGSWTICGSDWLTDHTITERHDGDTRIEVAVKILGRGD